MARGNGRRSSQGGYDRGRGRGYRGRGGSTWPERGRGRGKYGPNFLQDDLDFTLRAYDNAPSHVVNPPATGHQTPGKRGRGRGGWSTPGTPSRQANNSNSESNTPSRARGRGGAGYTSPRGRGHFNKVQNGGPIRSNTTLSNLLYQERPLLRPITFVPSVYTAVLFQNDDDELLKPIVEDIGDTAGHFPTADRISRVFSATNMPDEGEHVAVVDFNDLGTLFNVPGQASTSKTAFHTTDSPKIHQFTGAYPNKVQASSADVKDPVDVVNATLPTTREVHAVQKTQILPSNFAGLGKGAAANVYYVDLEPTPVMGDIGLLRNLPPSLSNEIDDDDIIVYEAPNPRISLTMSKDVRNQANPVTSNTVETLDKSQSDTITSTRPDPTSTLAVAEIPSTSIPELPAFSSVNLPISNSSSKQNTKATASSSRATSKTGRLRLPPVTTPRQAKLWQQKAKRASKRREGAKKRRAATFGAFGEMREETLLHQVDRERDERYQERRQGDSDLEWGDTEDDGVDNGDGDDDDDDERKVTPEEIQQDTGKVSGSPDSKGKGKAKEADEDHGMDVDPDLDIGKMTGFVQGLLGPGAGRHITVDDIDLEERIEMEDVEDEDQCQSSGSEEGETDAIMEAAEARFMDEMSYRNIELEGSSDEQDEDDDEIDVDENSFDARLRLIRAKAGAVRNGNGDIGWTSDEDEDDVWDSYMTWADGDNDDFLHHIHDILDENEDILTGRDRKQKKKLFDSVYDDMKGSVGPARHQKDKYKELPPGLLSRWEADRRKKADRKIAREWERLSIASDPLMRKKGGKKGRKAMLAAASFDSPMVVLPNRVIDMTTLVQQVRRFIADIGGPSSMSLPPTNKATRERIHKIAEAFGLKSVSKGKGDARYTTLTKKTTTTTGVVVDETKLSRILRRNGGAGSRGEPFYLGGKMGKGNHAKLPRHEEGDEVGKAAPRLNESNVGFRLLSNMGWSEGDRIGASMKGIEAPLAAIIKNSKLGLGAKK